MGLEAKEQSEFNMALQYLGRINGYLWRANEAAMELDALSWFHSLLIVYRELSTHMDNEATECEAFIKTIHPKIAVWNKNAMLGRREINHDLWTELHQFDLLLRRVMKESGIQGRTMGDPGAALR